MLQFLGGDSVENVTCEYLTAGDVSDSHHRQPQPVGSLPGFWENGWDISRSLWDHDSLVIHLDIEYVNFDFPVEPYLEPERIFDLQRPVEQGDQILSKPYRSQPFEPLDAVGDHPFPAREKPTDSDVQPEDRDSTKAMTTTWTT